MSASVPRDVDGFLYDAHGEDRPLSVQGGVVDKLASHQLLWVDVSTEEEIAAVASALDLAPATVRAIHDRVPQPSLFVHEAYVHLVLVASRDGADRAAPLVLDCLVGSNWVLTVHREALEYLDHLRDRIPGDSGLGNLDALGLVAALLHEHVASYLAALRPIEERLDRLDLRSMSGRINEELLLHELISTRLRVAQLRRLLEPHREVYALLTRSEFAVISGSESTAEFEALAAMLERAINSMDRAREMVVGSFEIYTTWTAHGTNKVIKRLTITSVTLLPPTLLAGIMGMNSLPSALASNAAFCVTTVAMLALALTVVTVARIREWL
jgi:magnesium transporter